ncbi:type IV secretory system conjugative DNA transfer family protein, partial [Salegentibacter sp. JZCK2]|nr:type IV secretory system conjugative DNA transfer family protein [Salegentibacter tibetensis]
MEINNLLTLILIIGLVSIFFYICFKLVNRFAFILNCLWLVALLGYGVQDSQWISALLFLGCPLLLINTILYVFMHTNEDSKNIDRKYQVNFATTKGKFKLENIKRGASIIGSAGSGKTESVVYGFLKHFQKEGFCGVIHDYKDFELTEMAYPLFKDREIPFKIISFDNIFHRVNPIAPQYLENEESVNEVSRVLVENLLEQRESGPSGTT